VKNHTFVPGKTRRKPSVWLPTEWPAFRRFIRTSRRDAGAPRDGAPGRGLGLGLFLPPSWLNGALRSATTSRIRNPVTGISYPARARRARREAGRPRRVRPVRFLRNAHAQGRGSPPPRLRQTRALRLVRAG